MTNAERTVIVAAVVEAATEAHLTKHDARVLLSMIRDKAECEILLAKLAELRAVRS